MALKIRSCVWSLCLAVSTPAFAWADTCLWTGGGANNLWSTAANWANCHAGGVPANGDSLSFPDGALRPSSSNNIVGLSVASITITGEGTSGYSLSGNSLSVTGGGITFDSSVDGAAVSLNVSFTVGQTIRNNGPRPALISGVVTINGVLTVNTTSGNINISGRITGTGGLTKTGANVLFLDGGGTSTYTGVSLILVGTVNARSVTALGATTAGNHTFVAGGATLASDFSSSLAEPLVVDGGTLSLVSTTGAYTGSITVSSDSLLNVPSSVSVLTVSGAISGTGSFTKIGAGTAILSGAGSHHGTTVNDGKLFVDGGSGAVPISLAGGVLGGSGQTGNVAGSSGSVSPGHSPGLLTTGNVALNAGTPLVVELNSAAAGAGYDQLNAIGTVALNNAPLNVTLGFAPPAGTSFTIISNDGTDPVSGTFSGLFEGAQFTLGSSPFGISYHGGDGNDVVLSTPPTSFTRYFAEGAANGFYATRIALVNPNASPANVTLRLLGQNGAQSTISRAVGANQRTTFDLNATTGLPDTVFSTVVESDRPVVADRLMTWDATGYGSSLETSIAAPGTTWYLAEGATGAYSLYYLLQNPGDSDASVTVSYLLPTPHPPITKIYSVAAHSRHTIDVAGEHPDLASAEVSAKITSTLPIVVERAMYTSTPGQFQAAGHDGAGLPASATRWFVAEGATGFFDEFVLIANAEASNANITVTYLLEGQPSFTESFVVNANSRYTLDLKRNAALLATPVSVIVESTNIVPVIVERVMWWPSGQPWYEASLSAGVTSTGTKWAIAEGEQGGPFNSATYVLIANTDAVTSGTATVTLLFENGTTDQTTIPLPANGRKTVDIGGTFASAANQRFGVIVESNGVPIVVERSFFSTVGSLWAAGATSVATNITPVP